MATKFGIRRAIDYLRNAGMAYAPQEPEAIISRVDVWMGALGHVDDAVLEVAARTWVSSTDVRSEHSNRGKTFPTPAELLEHTPRHLSGAPGVGCQHCAGLGALRGRWVCRNRSDGPLEERSRQLYCGCERGDLMRAQHARSQSPDGPIRMQHVDDFVAGLRGLHLIALDEPRAGVCWWAVEVAGEVVEVPEEVKATLRAQAQANAEKLAGVTRSQREEPVRKPANRQDERRAADRDDTWGAVGGAPLRADRGWGGSAVERFPAVAS